MSRMRSHLLLVVCVLSMAWGVDRSKFKKCEQSSFCKRNRVTYRKDRAGERDRFRIEANTVRIHDESAELTAKLIDGSFPMRTPLDFSMQILQNNVVRVRVNENKPLHKRWEVRDVLMDDAVKHGSAGILKKEKENVVMFTFGNSNEFEVHLLVEPAPFSLELFVKGAIALRLNSAGLLNFEPYRNKNPKPPAPPVKAEEEQKTDDAAKVANADAQAQAQAQAQEKPEEPAFKPVYPPEMHPFDEGGDWEESFGSHSDSKPRGPASVALDVSFMSTDHIFGIPEHASSLSLKNTVGDNAPYSDPYRLYNLDVFEYELDNPMSLYGSIPFVMSVSSGLSVGQLWLNSAETWVDVSTDKDEVGNPKKNVHWMSESGIIDVFLFVGPRPVDVFFQYASLTGFTQLPQQFAVAFHQCRWNYNSQDDVAAVDSSFDEHDIPVDVIWLDIEHTDGKKYFTWDKTHFSNPIEMQNKVAAKGRKMVTIVDPHIKRDSGYHVHSEAQSQGLYVKKAGGGADYEGWCWPGSVSYLDFVQPKVREYWASQFMLDKYQGSTSNLFTWNDMNEPSVFNGPEVTMYKDCLHGGDEQIEHRDVHNVYGFYVHKSSTEGHLKRDANSRPFVLTRAFFVGSQRYSAVWTGDNKADWSHLKATQPMLMSLAVSGYSFVGADVGGFFGDASAELFSRWLQVGAFHPFFRAHAHIDTKRREPWLFGEPYTSINRKAIRNRYFFLPYIYTTFHDASTHGFPVISPMWALFPDDPETYSNEDQFLLGKSLLVAPVTAQGQTSLRVYLPGSEPWYDIETFARLDGSATHEVSAPLDKIPVYQHGGSIVPKKERARRSSTLMIRDPYTLIVALDSKQSAKGHLYIDDGHSLDYRKGRFLHRTFLFANQTFRSEKTAGASDSSDGSFTVNNVIERIVVVGLNLPISSAVLKVDGSPERPIAVVTMGNNVQVLRKPDAPVAKDFEIVLLS